MKSLLGEIMEQPEAIERLIAEGYAEIQAVADIIRTHDVRYILIAARGSSDNAATYAKYLIGALQRLPVALAAPSLHTVYQAPPRLDGALVIAISQSGMSPDIVTVVQDARAQGALTPAITNTLDSRLAQAAECVIGLRAGQEHSVAATKTYTAELLALALLAVAWAGDDRRLAQLRALPQAVNAALAQHELIAQRAERYRYMTHCAVISRGYNYATAYEIALKLKEMTYSEANPYSSADFMHGPIAVVQPGFPVLAIAPSGPMLPNMMELLREVKQRNAELIVISDQGSSLELAQTPLRLPVAVEEWLSPITAIILGQLFAYYLALVKGLNPEHPRGLRKITETH